MRSLKSRGWLALLFAIVAGLAIFAPSASAEIRKPYLKVYSGDVFIGGWFNQGSVTCSNASQDRYQAPDYVSQAVKADTKYKGGLLAFKDVDGSNRPVGTTVDFGLAALGLVENLAASKYGAASGQTATAPDQLTFANKDGTGYYQGPYPQTHCIPDYFGTKQNNPATWPGSVNSDTPSKQYKIVAGGSPATVSNNEIKLRAKQRITLFVDGSAFISRNVSYEGNYKFDEIPQFTMVVKGNIYIAPQVKKLQGWYIAQPSESDPDNSGQIWTCHDPTVEKPSDNWLYSNCRNEVLRIDGAFTAKQVLFTRLKGDLSKAKYNEQPTDFDSGCNCSVNPNIAEIFVYHPEVVLSGAFFNENPDSGYTIQSLVNLPPVF